MRIYVEARDPAPPEYTVHIPADVARHLVLEAECRTGDTITVNSHLEEFFNELRAAVRRNEE